MKMRKSKINSPNYPRFRQVGFTLMELMIVVSLVLLIVGLGMTNYITQIKRSRDARRKADLEQIRAALEMIRADCGSYPVETPPWGASEWNVTCNGITSTYMRNVPKDPLSPAYSYYYTRPSASLYYICAYLEKSETTNTCPAGTVSCGGANCNYGGTNP